MDYIKLTNLPDRSKFIKGKKLVGPTIATELLMDSLGRRLEYNDCTNQWFVYELRGPGVWSPASDVMILSLISSVFRSLKLTEHISAPTYYSNIKQGFQCDHRILNPQYPINPREFTVFKNCVITPEGVKSHSPFPRCYTRLPYDYNPTAQCPRFLKFINEFCSDHTDRVDLIRAFMRCCIESNTFVQKFVEFVGEGKTGKSTLQTILTALVGLENTVITTLRDLNQNIFEASNLQHKKLIVVSDTEYYVGSVSVLKMITGNDFIIGRKKHVQEGYNILIEGMVAIFGNYPMYPRDATTGFLRRLILFPATSVVAEGKEEVLIRARPDGTFTGPISQELSGIYNWVMEMEGHKAIETIKNPRKTVPSLTDSVYKAAISANSIASWIDEELIAGEGLYIGGAHIDSDQAQMAYPMYISFCKRQGIKGVSLKVFSTNLISIIRSQYSERFPSVSLQKKRTGNYIEGIGINPIVFDTDYRRGGGLGPEWKPLNQIEAKVEAFTTSEIQIPNVERFTESENHSSPFEGNPIDTKDKLMEFVETKDQHPSLRPNLLKSYIEACSAPSRTKTFLKERAKYVDIDLNPEEFVPQGATASFVESTMKVLERGLRNYRKRGPVVSTYCMFGSSPRIGPYQYGTSYNAIKKSLRTKLVKWSANDLHKENPYTFIDIDIVSCYTSILLGLFGDKLPAVEKAVRNGLWASIEKEFQEKGYGDVFHKPSVKIAVHSSLFRGGNNAMINGIEEKWRKDAGLTPKEWKVCPDRLPIRAKAQEIVKILQTTNIIMEQRELSTYLEKKWRGTVIQGPTGHSYGVTSESFPSNYASFLQSYEISLLASAILNVRDQIPLLEVLGHFHDGALLIFPISIDKGQVEDLLQKEIENTRKALGLTYPQSFSFELLN